MKVKVLIRSGGDLASAVIQKLFRVGFDVVVMERKCPSMVRRTVSFSNAVYEGTYTVEGIEAVWIKEVTQIDPIIRQGKIPIITDEEERVYAYFKPDVFIDATLSKQAVTYNLSYAKAVIGLGPEIVAGLNAHIVVETARGHDLGRLIFNGKAKANTHVPGDIGGFRRERVLYAPCEGALELFKDIGDFVKVGETVATVAGIPVKAEIKGILRGLIHPHVPMRKGLKIGDVDPRGDVAFCHTISDKGRAIAGGVLEAVLILLKEDL